MTPENFNCFTLIVEQSKKRKKLHVLKENPKQELLS